MKSTISLNKHIQWELLPVLHEYKHVLLFHLDKYMYDYDPYYYQAYLFHETDLKTFIFINT